MAIIQIKRGLQAAVGSLTLANGEMAIATDTGNVYIGNGTGNIHLNPTGGMADEAVKLKTARNFSISGDGTAAGVAFDGTGNVNLALVLSTVSGLTAGTYSKVTVDAKGRVTAGTSIAVTDLPEIPSTKISGLPTKVSQFTNDANYQTATQVSTAVSALINAAPEALNTLNELAAALGNDPNFATTVTNQIANKESLLKNAAAKTGLVDADTMAICDSADSSTTKRVTLTVLKAALKTYFDTVYNKYIHPTYAAKTSGLYKVTVDATGHVNNTAPVVKSDITALGIPAQDTLYSLPTATAGVLGGVKIGVGFAITNGVLTVEVLDGGTF